MEVITNNKLDYEIIDVENDCKVLDNNIKNYNFTIEKDKEFIKHYKVKIKTNFNVFEDNLKIKINAKYYKKEINAYEISLDNRKLEYKISKTNSDSKYTNQDVLVKITCNKKIHSVSGFEQIDDNTLIKNYTQNCTEKIVLQDYFDNKREIEVSINNIDKNFPEILGIEDGNTYSSGLKLVYKDNIGIKNIKIENVTTKQIYNESFKNEKTIIDNNVLIVKNNEINPNFLKIKGSYIIKILDFAGNETIKHISIN